MGWPIEHLLVLRHRRVAGANLYTEFRHQEPGRQRCVADFNQWLLEVIPNVVTERFERRDVKHLGMIVEITRRACLKR